MVEITNDTEFIPPLVLATFVAAIVGNLFNREFSVPRRSFVSPRAGVPHEQRCHAVMRSPADGYYHEMIHLNHLPLLHDHPSTAQKAATVGDVMAAPAVTIRSDAPLQPSVAAMLGCDGDDPKAKHAGYPVIDGDGRLVGLVDAADIVLSDGGSGTIISDVMNAQVATAQASQPAAFAFTLYRRLGQRHVPVVDVANRPVGMVTRHDLDAHKAEVAVGAATTGATTEVARPHAAAAGEAAAAPPPRRLPPLTSAPLGAAALKSNKVVPDSADEAVP